LYISGALVGAVIDIIRGRPYWFAMACFSVLWSGLGLWAILERLVWARLYNAFFFGGMGVLGLAGLWLAENIPAWGLPIYWFLVAVFGVFAWIAIMMLASTPIKRYFEEPRAPKADRNGAA